MQCGNGNRSFDCVYVILRVFSLEAHHLQAGLATEHFAVLSAIWLMMPAFAEHLTCIKASGLPRPASIVFCVSTHPWRALLSLQRCGGSDSVTLSASEAVALCSKGSMNV